EGGWLIDDGGETNLDWSGSNRTAESEAHCRQRGCRSDRVGVLWRIAHIRVRGTRCLLLWFGALALRAAGADSGCRFHCRHQLSLLSSFRKTRERQPNRIARENVY